MIGVRIREEENEYFLREAVPIEEYLKNFPKLFKLFKKSFNYLPTLEGKNIYIEPFSCLISRNSLVLGYTRRDNEKENVWYIGFKHHPPDKITFLHELIHVAGGDELSSYNYAILLYYAIQKNLPPFNLLDLVKIDLETLNKVMNKCGFKNIEDFFEFMGILPTTICYFDYLSGRIRLRKDVDEFIIVQNTIAEISGGLAVWYEFMSSGECQLIECRVFEELAKYLANKNQINKEDYEGSRGSEEKEE